MSRPLPGSKVATAASGQVPPASGLTLNPPSIECQVSCGSLALRGCPKMSGAQAQPPTSRDIYCYIVGIWALAPLFLAALSWKPPKRPASRSLSRGGWQPLVWRRSRLASGRADAWSLWLRWFLPQPWRRHLTGNDGIFKGNHPQMAQFRLVNDYNLPRPSISMLLAIHG